MRGLRQWFHHDPARFAEFAERYQAELGEGEAGMALARLRDLVRSRSAVTLLFAARDPQHNQATVLARLLGGSKERLLP